MIGNVDQLLAQLYAFKIFIYIEYFKIKQILNKVICFKLFYVNKYFKNL